MSVVASIDFSLVDPWRKCSILELITALLDYGWSLHDEWGTCYLPAGDGGDYNWKRGGNDNEVLQIVKDKEVLKEDVGVVMTWGDSNVGGEFIFWKDGSISISLSVNRRTLKGVSVTDVSWYLARLVSVINDKKLIIEGLKFSEHV